MQKIKGIAECIYKIRHFEENLYKMQFGWSDLRDSFYMISFLIECLLNNFHQVPIKNAQVMVIVKFC